MRATDLITDLRAQLGRVRAQGVSAVQVGALEAYLAAVEPFAAANGDAAATDQALARGRHEFEVWKVRAPMEHAASMEMFRSVIEAGQTALRSLILINGGAAVALLAFLGNVLSKEAPKGVQYSVAGLKLAMLTFVLGVGSAGAATAFRYLTQWAGALRWLRTSHVLNWAAILFGLGSLGAFFWGGLKAYWAVG